MQLRIAYERGGYRLMVSTNGIDARPSGPLWTTPAEASRFYDSYLVNHPQAVSPLRSGQDDRSPVKDLPAPTPAVSPLLEGEGGGAVRAVIPPSPTQLNNPPPDRPVAAEGFF